MISLEKYIVRDSEAVWRKLDDEVFIIDQAGEKVFALNKTAAFIWELAGDNMSISEIVKQICTRFEIDEATARTDISELVGEMLEKRIISLNDRPH